MFYCKVNNFSELNCAGILLQSVGARNRLGIYVVVPARRSTKAGKIDSLELIPGLLESLKTPPLLLCPNLVQPLSKMNKRGFIFELLILKNSKMADLCFSGKIEWPRHVDPVAKDLIKKLLVQVAFYSFFFSVLN